MHSDSASVFLLLYHQEIKEEIHTFFLPLPLSYQATHDSEKPNKPNNRTGKKEGFKLNS